MGVHPSINCSEKDGNKILIIEVENSTLPIAYEGIYYKRVGSTTRPMITTDLREFFF